MIKGYKFNKAKLSEVAKYYHNPEEYIIINVRIIKQYKCFVIYYYNDAPKEFIEILKED